MGDFAALAVLGDEDHLEEGELLAAVLARPVLEVLVPVEVHQAEPLEERVKAHMRLVQADAAVLVYKELLVGESLRCHQFVGRAPNRRLAAQLHPPVAVERVELEVEAPVSLLLHRLLHLREVPRNAARRIVPAA